VGAPIGAATDTPSVGFDIVDAPVGVDVGAASRPPVGTLLLVSADEDVCVDIVVFVAVSRPSTATFCVLVLVPVDGGGSAALSLCMRPICMLTPSLFLNLLPHTLHVHNSEGCGVVREEVAHVITVPWSVSDEKVENTLELIGHVIGGFS